MPDGEGVRVVDPVLWDAARQINASLDLDEVLAITLQAAARLTQAHCARIYLSDPATGELLLHAGDPPGAVCSVSQPVCLPINAQAQLVGVLEVEVSASEGGAPESGALSVETLAQAAGLLEITGAAVARTRCFAESETARRRLETVFEQIEDGLLVLDEQGRLALVNGAARAMFNFGPAAPLGKPTQRAIPNAEIHALLGQDTLHEPRRLELALDDGRVVNGQVSPIEGVGLAIVMQDITNLKEVDRIKSDFVSTVSHDLRSPLTAILGYADLVERVGPVTEQQRDFLQRIQFSVQNITALINGLLELGRIEAGYDGRMETVQLDTLASFILEEMQSRFAQKKQVVSVDFPGGLPPVLGSPLMLRQLLTNLVSNAHKYTQAGGKIAISGRTSEEQLIIQVSDNGPGIPPGEQQHIFEKFYRASNVPGDVPGTGLGLAIVKTIVEKHRGRIWVDAVAGKGSVFTLVLPVAAAAR